MTTNETIKKQADVTPTLIASFLISIVMSLLVVALFVIIAWKTNAFFMLPCIGVLFLMNYVIAYKTGKKFTLKPEYIRRAGKRSWKDVFTDPAVIASQAFWGFWLVSCLLTLLVCFIPMYLYPTMNIWLFYAMVFMTLTVPEFVGGFFVGINMPIKVIDERNKVSAAKKIAKFILGFIIGFFAGYGIGSFLKDFIL